MTSNVDESSIKRRQILSGIMKLLFFIGFVFLSVPFISSFSTNSIDSKIESKTNWIITLSTLDLAQGEIKKLTWSGGLVWVYSRTKKDIQSLGTLDNTLRDALSAKSDQPDNMKTIYRSDNKQFFVFIPQENKRGCQVRLAKEDENILFTEPCFRAKYDAAGRILNNSGHKEQSNLSVPKHVIENGILKVGIWRPKPKGF